MPNNRKSWLDLRRPIFNERPKQLDPFPEGGTYDQLTQWIDKVLTGTLDAAVAFKTKLDPLTCPEEYLDLLALLTGFTGRYWGDAWPTNVKRLLIDQAYKLIWPYHGTERVLRYVLDAYPVRYRILTRGQFRADVSKADVDKVGQILPLVDILITTTIPRTHPEFKYAQLVRNTYVPAVTGGKVMYSHFMADRSVTGDRVMD